MSRGDQIDDQDLEAWLARCVERYLRGERERLTRYAAGESAEEPALRHLQREAS